MNIRPLRADEIEARIGTVGAKGVSILLYKNARVDMTILDEMCTPFGWQRDHKEIKGNLYCGIGIWNEVTSEWVWKWDCGTESYTEKEKGEASDSFKRAGFCWGIGRELYNTPFIFIPVATSWNDVKKKYEMANPNDLRGMYVREFEVDELDGKRIVTKVVINQKAQHRDDTIYSYDAYERK